MDKLTQKDLDKLLEKINAISTKEQYTFEQAYGGIKLTNISQNVDISINGFETRRNLYNFMQGFYKGIISND